MTTTYSVSRDTIITSALRKLQVIELGVTPDSTTLANAGTVLNYMIKAWQTQGIKLWTVQNYIVPLTASTNSYTVGSLLANTAPSLTITTPNQPVSLTQTNDKPLKVIQAWMRNVSVTPNIDTPLQILSRQEYNILGSKGSSGMVNSVWYEPNTTWGTVYTYLTPDSATATNYQLYLVGQRPLADILLGTDVPDFPNEWLQALVWGLADELAIEYGTHINQRQEISAKAKKFRDELEGWDTDTTSTFFTPDLRMQGR
jgi:hypothetical protein